MLTIGLTGGIGSGKSTAAKFFAKLKVPVIDADKVVHQLLEPNTTTYRKIIRYFGNTIVDTSGQLNRKKLRHIIFSNKKKRAWLENLLHPIVLAKIKKNAKKLHARYCIMVIPLLFETKFPIKLDRILVIDAPIATQIKRAHRRGYGTIKQIRAVIGAQTKRNLRLSRANEVINNIKSLSYLEKNVKKMHKYYLSMT